MTDPEYWKLKGYCEDLSEGKLSYLLIKLLDDDNTNDNDNKNSIFTLLKNNDIKSKKEIIQMLEKNNIFTKTYDKLTELKNGISCETHIFNDVMSKIDIKSSNIDVILDYKNDFYNNEESNKTDVIFSDFDGTICSLTSTYIYILFILNLSCSSFSEQFLKYLKITILLFLFPFIMILNVFNCKYACYVSNYIIFNNLNINQIDQTVKKIKPKIIKKLNTPVLTLINNYSTVEKNTGKKYE